MCKLTHSENRELQIKNSWCCGVYRGIYEPFPGNHCGRYHVSQASDGRNQKKAKELNPVLGKDFRCFSTVLLFPKSCPLVFLNKILNREVGSSLPSSLPGLGLHGPVLYYLKMIILSYEALSWRDKSEFTIASSSFLLSSKSITGGSLNPRTDRPVRHLVVKT